MITYSLSPHLSFTSNLRLISSSDHSRLSLHAPLHYSRFSDSHNLAFFSFHITVSLISSHFICYTAYYGGSLTGNQRFSLTTGGFVIGLLSYNLISIVKTWGKFDRDGVVLVGFVLYPDKYSKNGVFDRGACPNGFLTGEYSRGLSYNILTHIVKNVWFDRRGFYPRGV